LAFGALIAMALSALLIWFVLADSLFILYATLVFPAGAVCGLSFRPGFRLALVVLRATVDLVRVERAGELVRRRGVFVSRARSRI